MVFPVLTGLYPRPLEITTQGLRGGRSRASSIPGVDFCWNSLSLSLSSVHLLCLPSHRCVQAARGTWHPHAWRSLGSSRWSLEGTCERRTGLGDIREAGEWGEEEPRASRGQELGSRWTLSKLGPVLIQQTVNRQSSRGGVGVVCNPELRVSTPHLSLCQDLLYSTSFAGS